MPTPPRESIGGTKGHQIAMWEFSHKIYNELESIEALKKDAEWDDISMVEQTQIDNYYYKLEDAYNDLLTIVDSY